MKRFALDAAVATHQGRVRNNNEDNFYFDGLFLEGEAVAHPFEQAAKKNSRDAIFAVCDGMGGEAFGEEASLLAVQTIQQFHPDLTNKHKSYLEVIEKCINQANQTICDRSVKHGKRSGATMAVLHFDENKVTATNLGDSRIYLYRNQKLEQISTDHTQVQTLLKSGVISPQQAMTHASRNKLTQHLGIFPDELILEPASRTLPDTATGDVWLLCSDGLTDMLGDAEIRSVIQSQGSATGICSTLVSMALARGGLDNITVLVVCVKDKLLLPLILLSGHHGKSNAKTISRRIIWVLALISLAVALVILFGPSLLGSPSETTGASNETSAMPTTGTINETGLTLESIGDSTASITASESTLETTIETSTPALIGNS
jgi:PPM family protein phosphatase